MLIPAAILVGTVGKTAADKDVEVAHLHLGCRKRLPRATHGAPLVEDIVGKSRVTDEQGVARRRDDTAEHLVGVAILEKAAPRTVVQRQNTVRRHLSGEALQRGGSHLQRIGIVIEAERRSAPVHDIVGAVAIVQRPATLSGRLQTVGKGIVQRHVLRIVHLQRTALPLNLVNKRHHIGFLAVTVMEIECHQRDVILRLGVAVQQVVAILLQYTRPSDVVQQTVRVGNLAVALQQTCTQQATDNHLNLAILHSSTFRILHFPLRHLLHTVQHLIGILMVRHQEIGERHVVHRTHRAVDIFRQRVTDIVQRPFRQEDASIRILVAIKECFLVQSVDMRTFQRVDRGVSMTPEKQQNGCKKTVFYNRFHAAKIQK